MIGKPELKLAQRIGHTIWTKYDDTFGYRSSKQAENDAVSIENPGNIWFFWGQFDINNQEDFMRRVKMQQGRAAANLLAWCKEQMAENERSIEALKEKGIDFRGLMS